MEGNEFSSELSSFINSGIYHLDGSNIVFLDPVRILNGSYTRFRLSPFAYYSRSFKSKIEAQSIGDSSNSKKKKKKRKRKAPRDLNEREIAAEQRHQELRPLLVNAHAALLGAAEVLRFLPNVVKGVEDSVCDASEEELNFIELASHSNSSSYEISIRFGARNTIEEVEGSWQDNYGGKTTVPIFINLISNQLTDDVESEFFNRMYILPSRSCFYMSDLRQIRDLIPAQSDLGFKLIVIDAPWENGSVYQKAMYPTLPNRYFLYLPVKELAHREGALVALWMTNREKLWMFVENELFPAWGVTHVTKAYWLKVKPDGSLIGELDLSHHRPYESLLIGYVNLKSVDSSDFTCMQNNRVFISIPGAYSRKPPLGRLLREHIPGPWPARCLELFARELVGGWTSWGNEPLRFQDAKYFVEKSDRNGAI